MHIQAGLRLVGKVGVRDHQLSAEDHKVHLSLCNRPVAQGRVAHGADHADLDVGHILLDLCSGVQIQSQGEIGVCHDAGVVDGLGVQSAGDVYDVQQPGVLVQLPEEGCGLFSGDHIGDIRFRGDRLDALLHRKAHLHDKVIPNCVPDPLEYQNRETGLIFHAAAELVRAVVEASGDPLAKQEPMSAVDRDPVHAAGLDHAGAVGEGVRDLVHPRFAHLIDVVPVAGIRRVVLTGHAVVFLVEGQFRRAHDGLGAVRAAVRVPGSGCLQHPEDVVHGWHAVRLRRRKRALPLSRRRKQGLSRSRRPHGIRQIQQAVDIPRVGTHMPEVHKGQRTVPVAGVHIFFCIQKQLLRGLFDKVPVMPRHGAAEFHVVFRPDDPCRAAGGHPLVKIHRRLAHDAGRAGLVNAHRRQQNAVFEGFSPDLDGAEQMRIL